MRNSLKNTQTESEKGGLDMSENKEIKKEGTKEQKPLTKPGDIKGKIEVSDTRERRDGPGGN